MSNEEFNTYIRSEHEINKNYLKLFLSEPKSCVLAAHQRSLIIEARKNSSR